MKLNQGKNISSNFFRSVRRELLRTKAIVFDEDEDSAGRDLGEANGGVYTRLAQSDEVAVNLLKDEDDDED